MLHHFLRKMIHLKYLDHKDHLWIVTAVHIKLNKIYSKMMIVNYNFKKINQGNATECLVICLLSLNLYLKNGNEYIKSKTKIMSGN